MFKIDNIYYTIIVSLVENYDVINVRSNYYFIVLQTFRLYDSMWGVWML